MTTTANLLDQVRVYVGTYAKYNNGSIFGEWLTLGDYSDLSEFYDACKELHADEEDPELMFQDYETPEILKDLISECGINDEIFEISALLEGEDVEMISAYISLGYDLTEQTIEDAKDKFFGYYESDEALAEDYVEQTGILNEVPESLRYYFDYASYGRDLAFDFQEFNGYYFNN